VLARSPLSVKKKKNNKTQKKNLGQIKKHEKE